MKPTYHELEEQLSLTREELNDTKQQLAKYSKLLQQALTEIANLKEQLNKNSKNSSKPPSSDQKGNTPPKTPRKRKGRGGVARAKIPPERVNHYVECFQKNCPHCNSSSIELKEFSSKVLQQVELPQVQAIVTEYLLRKYSCNLCGKKSTASLPEGIPNSAFGPNLMALVGTLTGVYHLAKREALQLIKDLYDIDIGLGSVSNIEEKITKVLDPICQRIHHFIIESDICKHFDETGWRNAGKRHYAWLASCKEAAFYRIDRRRNQDAFQKLIQKDPRDFAAVTDRYSVYNVIKKLHQYCLAHLIRDFRSYAERDGSDKEIGSTLADILSKVCQIHGEYREGKISKKQRNQRLRYQKNRVKIALEDGMANGSDKLFKLSEKLLDEFDHLWVFMKVDGMEPTNNLAERDMRKLVIWRKKSYGTRSERGKRFVERITTVAQTAKRQGENILSFIQGAILSFYRNNSAPLISETMGF